MIKKSLAVGIVFLFVFSTVTSMVVGFDYEHEIKSQNLLVYDICNKTINIDYKEDIDIPNNIIIVEDEEEFLEQMTFLSYRESDIDVRYRYYKEKILQENSEVAENIEIKIKKLKSLSNTKSGGLMESSWPMRNHDIQHTGRSPYSTENVTGLEKWRFCNRRQGWGGLDGGPIIDNDGIIYFGDKDGCVYAVYPNGTMKWQTKLDCMIKSTPAIDENGILYIGTVVTTTNYFHAIYTNNGSIKWKYRTGHNVFSSPVISNDGTIIFGDNNNGINALNPNGTLKWRFKTDGSVYSSPVIGEDGTIYCGCHVTEPKWEGRFYALNPNGTLRWKYNASHWIRVAPCIDDDGIVYFGSIDGYLHAAYPNNGTLKWKIKFPDGNTYPAVGHDGIIYAGLDKLRAIYPENGTIKWAFNLGSNHQIEGGGPIISEDGTIYIGTRIVELDGGDIIAINANGKLKWRKKICDTFIDSSLAIGKDGTVYIGSSSEGRGYLHAFGPVESNSPPDTPTIDGPTWTRTGIRIWNTFSTVDPDNNPVSFYIDWGDDTNTGWTTERASGEKCYYEHAWSKKGNYIVKAKVKDVMGEESDWSYYEVEIVKPRLAFLYGEIYDYHYIEGWDDIKFKAENLIVIHLVPPSFNRYTSGEQIYGTWLNLRLTSKFASGLYPVYYPPTVTSS